jgi:hypothetical protein
MHQTIKNSITPPDERDLTNRLLEAQSCLVDLYKTSQRSLAEATSLNSQGMTPWSSEDLKLVFLPSVHRSVRLISILKAFGNRHLIKQSRLYDKDWYLSRYPDVQTSGLTPDFHFLLFGMHEGRDPGPDFSQLKYALFYKDVLLSRSNPLLHYVTHGKSEGRLAFTAGQ